MTNYVRKYSYPDGEVNSQNVKAVLTKLLLTQFPEDKGIIKFFIILS